MHIKAQLSQLELEQGLSLAISENMLKINIFKELFEIAKNILNLYRLRGIPSLFINMSTRAHARLRPNILINKNMEQKRD